METNIQEKFMRAYEGRIERELYAAYRSDYDYLYVVEDRRITSRLPGDETALPGFAAIPSDSDELRFDGYYVTRYTVSEELDPTIGEKMEKFK